MGLSEKEQEAAMRMDGQDEAPIADNDQSVTMPGGNCQPAFCVQIELCRALKHKKLPRLPTCPHFIPPILGSQ